ncbi:PEP-CTERM sorting domain-containing protein [Nitrosomonas sp.]|uniref:PEP-CTERM sorting domain-containing protein n=1 Tax=Nitrosomonas sp. TaxID=42353 RepID=UPI0025D2C682|nr:PEP-CTERM sorting domain-containing protein [Nitrosomonas sp.]
MKIIKTITCAAILIFVGGVAQATTLKVDISDSVADVASGYAGFVFSNNTVPGSRNYSVGDAGYVGGSIDTGSGIMVTLASSGSVYRLVDRGGDNFLRDYGSIDGALNKAQDVVLSGLTFVSGTFTASLDDLGNQFGVIDVQLSVDGGTSFTNVLDDVTYGSTDNGYTVNFTSNGNDDVIIRYTAGGNVFGNTTGTTDNIRRNRLVAFNGFDLTANPVSEPSSTALLGLGGLALFLRRRARKV